MFPFSIGQVITALKIGRMVMGVDIVVSFNRIIRKTLIALILAVTGTSFAFSSNRPGISSQASVWADSVYSILSLEERVSQLFVADFRDGSALNKLNRVENQPAFILGSPTISSKRWPKQSSTLIPVLIPDLCSGFETGNTDLPFPDEQTISFMEIPNQLNLLGHLKYWMNTNKYKAIFATGNYIFETDNYQKSGHSILLPISGFENGLPQAYALKVHNTPWPLIRLLPSFTIQDYSGSKAYNKVSAPFFARNSNVTDLAVEQLLESGNIFLTTNFEYDYERILLAFKNRWLTMESLEQMCKSILAFKFELLQQKVPDIKSVPLKSLETELRLGYESAIGIYQSTEDSPFPLVHLNLNVGYLSDGNGYFDEFKTMASNYIFDNNPTRDPSEYHIVFWLVGPSVAFDIPIEEKILEIKSRFPRAFLVMVRTGDISQLPFLGMPSGLDALVITPSNRPLSWSAMAQAVFNGIRVNIKKTNFGVSGPLGEKSISAEPTRLKYGIPEEVGLNSDTLALINGIVDDAIRKSAFPGAQVLVVKNGVVVFNKNYGWMSYDKAKPVTSDVIYDLASITKVMATLPVLMQQYDNGRWRLFDKLSDFVPQADSTDKKDITMRQLLLHESGLPAFIPFYTEAIDRSKLNGNLYSNRKTALHSIKMDDRLFMNKTAVYRNDVFRSQYDLNFSVPVANNLFMNVFYIDSMMYRMLSTRADVVPKYRYSDLNFLFLQRVSENLAQESLDLLADNSFYKPMGASSLCFNPWKNTPVERIAPTENDLAFRHQLLQGYVHDPGAAMMGGVAGHAGLFGNANDLAKMSQMLLNNGIYGGYKYLKDETVKFFTSQQSPSNRRGLGFDKPEINPTKNGSFSNLATSFSYGHTGFTGTIVWIDPAYDIIFIFLSNRIHPYAYNKKIMELGVRPRIHSIIYQAIKPQVF